MEEVASTLQQMEVVSGLKEGAHVPSIWRWPTEPTHPNKPSEEGKNPSNLSEQERAWHDEALTERKR